MGTPKAAAHGVVTATITATITALNGNNGNGNNFHHQYRRDLSTLSRNHLCTPIPAHQALLECNGDEDGALDMLRGDEQLYSVLARVSYIYHCTLLGVGHQLVPVTSKQRRQFPTSDDWQRTPRAQNMRIRASDTRTRPSYLSQAEGGETIAALPARESAV
eukprot:CAMPEP_0119530898 /NCGR_PEP_ID=MMETSP1344-20130328/44679_1 /TAXON_ID=236787 /ORGANISM="Florenciella parvula, Strain CCMP2471" /LENGTH=160 /DNA_ID=CAMNT_0007571001 /DNA_START=176 /DNA_END=656 /DNA_ORIENTATION=-